MKIIIKFKLLQQLNGKFMGYGVFLDRSMSNEIIFNHRPEGLATVSIVFNCLYCQLKLNDITVLTTVKIARP